MASSNGCSPPVHRQGDLRGVRGLPCRFPVMPTQAWSYGLPSDLTIFAELLGEQSLHRHVTLLVLYFINMEGNELAREY